MGIKSIIRKYIFIIIIVFDESRVMGLGLGVRAPQDHGAAHCQRQRPQTLQLVWNLKGNMILVNYCTSKRGRHACTMVAYLFSVLKHIY